MRYPMNISELTKRHVPVVALLLWVVVSSLVNVPWSPRQSEDREAVYHTILLLSDGYQKPRSVAYEAVVMDSIGAWQRRERVMLYLIPSYDTVQHPLYRAGDVVTGKMKLERGRGVLPQWESGRVTRLRGRDIPLTSGRLTYYAIRTRRAIEKLFEQYFTDSESLALIEALLLGDRRILSRDQRYAFTDAGAMHVLAVSGLHVGIVRDVLLFLFSLGGLLFIPWEKKGLRIAHRMVIISGVWVYAFVTGMSVSVMRSALMFSFLPLGRHQTDSPIKYNRIAAAALIILLINPQALYAPSFLLSFSAVVAIIYYTPRWDKMLSDIITFSPRKKSSIFQRCSRWLKQGLLVSLAAQIGVLPWTMFFFGQSSNYFALTNLVIIPLTWLTVIVSLAAVLIAILPLPVVIKTLIMSCSEQLGHAMNSYVTFVQHLPGSTSFFTFDAALTALLIFFIITLSVFMRLYEDQKRYAWVALVAAVAAGAAMILHYAEC